MFGALLSQKIVENVVTVLSQKPRATLEEVYRELMMLYGIDASIEQHPSWPQMWALLCDAPTIQRRVRELQAASSIDR